MSYKVKKFHKQDFIEHVYDPHSLEFSRKRDRGFVPFIADVIDVIANDNAFQQDNISLVELGIGGGGAHYIWDCHLHADIYGVELYSPDIKEYDPDYEFFKNPDPDRRNRANYKHAQHMVTTTTQVEFYYGMDAYKESTAKFIFEKNKKPISVVIDDASPSGHGLRTLLPAWKPYIYHNGCIMSETIYGNGSPEISVMTEEEQLDMLKVAHDQGFVCFDFKKYAYENAVTEDILHHFVFWSPNFGQFRDVLDKYEDCRVKF
jgi:hypothetical protein